MRRRDDARRHLSLDHIYRQYFPLVRSVCGRTLGNHPGIPDLIQDIFINVYESLPSFRESEPLGPWIATIARRRCLDVIRRENRSIREQPAGLEIDNGATIDPALSIDEALDARAILRVIAPAFRDLTPRQRRAMLRLVVDGWSHQEISQELDIEVVATRALIHRAREKVRRCLAEAN